MLKLRRNGLTETEKARRNWFYKQYGLAVNAGMITTIPKKRTRETRLKWKR